MAPTSPVVARWALGVRLRLLREQAGHELSTFARAIGTSPANLSNIEKGNRSVSPDKVKSIAAALDADSDDVTELLNLLADSKIRAWWNKSSALIGADLQWLYGMEYGADTIRTYESILVPGLLQCEEYARATIEADLFVREVEADQRIAIRLRRQERLFDDDALKLTAIFSEAALAHQTGGISVRRKQLEYLTTVLKRHRNIEVRVIPFHAKYGVVLGGAGFHLLDFPDPQLPTVGWYEGATFGRGVEEPTQIRDMRFAYVRALGQALNQEESMELIAQYARA